jgi:signal transduction histidine kinase
MRHLRSKLLVAMLTIVVVTVGVSALFTRRVTHEEMRKLLVVRPPADVTPLAAVLRAHGDVSQAFAQTHMRGILTDAQHRVIATSPDLAHAAIRVRENGVTIDQDGRHLVLLLPPDAIRDGGRVVGFAYLLPERPPAERHETEALDRRLVITFAAATLVAIALTILLSRRITRPIERLTSAVDEMARGAVPSPVAADGKDEIAQLARSFNAMAASIANQQELRRRMVSDVAHELRTPLTNLRCELEAIQDGLAAADAPRITSLHEETLHLGRLVDDLQELAVADAGGLQLHAEPLDLGAAVGHIADRFRGEAERRRIALTIGGEDDVRVTADPMRIAQIVRNLLTNAMQHTPDGGSVAIRIAGDGECALVSIADSGSGIPAAELENIFERFYRLDESRDRNNGGAGLGLAIVRRLVELHGGMVWAESSPAGATFTFALPLHHTFTSRS